MSVPAPSIFVTPVFAKKGSATNAVSVVCASSLCLLTLEQKQQPVCSCKTIASLTFRMSHLDTHMLCWHQDFEPMGKVQRNPNLTSPCTESRQLCGILRLGRSSHGQPATACQAARARTAAAANVAPAAAAHAAAAPVTRLPLPALHQQRPDVRQRGFPAWGQPPICGHDHGAAHALTTGHAGEHHLDTFWNDAVCATTTGTRVSMLHGQKHTRLMQLGVLTLV